MLILALLFYFKPLNLIPWRTDVSVAAREVAAGAAELRNIVLISFRAEESDYSQYPTENSSSYY